MPALAQHEPWNSASSPGQLLRRFNLPRTWLRLNVLAALLGGVFGVPALVLALCGTTRSEAAANILVAAAGVTLALFQWRQVQREEAWEHNVARLDKVNEFFATNFADAKKVVPLLLPSPEYHYVYLELDLLEHALKKHQRGLESPEDVLSRIHTFAKRSREQSFRDLVPHCLEQGSYDETAHRIANMVINNPGLRDKVAEICEGRKPKNRALSPAQ